MTEWKDVAGAPGYRVSDAGEVKSELSGRLLRQTLHDGYPRVRIKFETGLKTVNVATLVCAAFHGPRPTGYQVAHLDGTRLNSSAKNLAWKTPKENMEDRLAHGRAPRGERCGASKLTDVQAGEIRSRYVRGFGRWHRGNCRDLAEEYGVGMDTIWSIATGKTRSN